MPKPPQPKQCVWLSTAYYVPPVFLTDISLNHKINIKILILVFSPICYIKGRQISALSILYGVPNDYSNLILPAAMRPRSS